MFEDLYKTKPGRMAARFLASPFISYAAGAFMSCSLSKPMIKRFARKNGIDLSEAEKTKFKSFNDFFTRRLKAGLRPVCNDAGALVSPSDGLLSVYDINESSRFVIKNVSYDLKELTEDERVPEIFKGGKCLIFRLTPAHYHRYIFPCDGEIIESKQIKGIYHTVRPTAVENTPVYHTNTREYALCECGETGKLLIMEVGAMLVGRIVNHKRAGTFKKGEEKGYFEFGGSTIVVLAQKDKVNLDAGLSGTDEKPVKAGQRLGESIGKAF